MECSRCKKSVTADEAVEQGGATLCEDCLMDAMSPARACDPWAVKLAKGATTAGGAAEADLKGLEKALFELVRKRGAVPAAEVPELLGVRRREIDRAFAVLRHMELLRGRRGPEGQVDYVMFSLS